MTAARLLRAYLVEAKYESLRMLRAPGFAIPFLGLPVMLYLLFAVLIFGAAVRSEPLAGKALFTAFAVMGVIGPGMFGFGVIVAMERDQGYLVLKRALPMPPAANFVARMLMAMIFAALVMISVAVAALTAGHVALTIGELLATFAVGVAGALPFCAMGLAIGAYVSGRAAAAVVNLVYLPMLHLSGLFYPLPAFLQSIAPIWPPYHLNRLALAAAGAPVRGEAATHAAILVAETLLFGLIAVRRLDKEERRR